ncbi:DUF4262 domain-containing protein [Micromonospora sp. C95]|uniref:DUF4262 domain-containing protein n=1 Tax=Micromonospora sp. C95 TaxID=2824882 RepID=UPI001B36DE86|nr:DUF4262 domain-containing protein [Micromonospora sp. C95]MBQ1022783.1 DUF4262 domain-containing protein [Micromonospora sp. C95]
MSSPDDSLRQQQRHMNDVSWSVTAVLPNPDEPDVPFANTFDLIGRDLPELVIAGLHPLVAHQLLNDIADRVYHSGQRLTHGQPVGDLIIGYDAVIVDEPATGVLYPGAAYARSGAHRVRLRQIAWPDIRRRFPWDDGYEDPAHVQPLLGHP